MSQNEMTDVQSIAAAIIRLCAEKTKGHSLWGIASFAVVLATWATQFFLFALGIMVDLQRPDHETLYSIVGVVFLLCMLINIVGAAIALPGAFSKTARPLFGILGLVLNILTFFAMVGLCILGMTTK